MARKESGKFIKYGLTEVVARRNFAKFSRTGKAINRFSMPKQIVVGAEQG